METLFIPVNANTSITISPSDINNRIDDKLRRIIKNDVEGKCIKEGYVKENSVNIINRSLGTAQSSTFNGSFIYHVNYTMEICNPLEGMELEVQAQNINKMGILAGVPYQQISPLNVMIAKQYHIDNKQFSEIREDDIFKVRVLGKRYEYGDSQISIIAVLEDEYQKFNK